MIYAIIIAAIIVLALVLFGKSLLYAILRWLWPSMGGGGQ